MCVYIYLDDYDLNDDTWIFGNWYRRYINSISKNTTIPMGIFHMEICLKCFTHPACQPNLLRRHSLSRKSCEKLCSCVFMANCRWTKKTSLPGYLKREALKLGQLGPSWGNSWIPRKSSFFGGDFWQFQGGSFFWDLELWILFTIVMMFILHVHEMHIIGTLHGDLFVKWIFSS